MLTTTVGMLAMVTNPCAAATEVPRPVPLLELLGEEPGDRFGSALAVVGDVDGDGVPDLAVGAPRASGPPGFGPSFGRVRVFSGRTGDELRSWSGAAQSDRFGTAVSGVGDVDGDGRGDVLVGAPAGRPPAGRVELRSGRTGEVLLRVEGAAAGDGFGRAVAGVGDVDRDGGWDFAVGAPFADGNGTNSGRVTVFSGVDGAVLATLDGERFDQLGLAVAAAGDADGDGHDDVAIGAPFADAAAFNGGSALVFSPRRGVALRRLDGAEVGELLGHALGSAGDLDGDGLPELWVGAPGADAGAIDAGRVVGYDPRAGREVVSLPGRFAGEGLFQAAGAGDLDGDGRGELALGSPAAGGDQAGHLRVVSLARRRVLSAATGPEPRAWLGARVVAVGDLDGDGLPELAVGAPGSDDRPDLFGRVLVFAGRDLWRGPAATREAEHGGEAPPRKGRGARRRP